MSNEAKKQLKLEQIQDRIISFITAALMLGVVLAAMGLKPAIADTNRMPAVISEVK